MLYDNSGYGEIKRYMEATDVAPVGVDLFTPDLMAIAKASGWSVDRCEKANDLPEILQKAKNGEKPVMIRYTDALRSDFARSIRAVR